MTTDQQLIERVVRGDHGAFQLIIKNTERLVAQIVYKMIQLPEDRKDLAQDIYLKAYQGLPTFRLQAKLSTWIGQIAYHTCLHFLEKKKLPLLPLPAAGPDANDDCEREEPAPDSLPNATERWLWQQEQAEILTREIAQLPPVYQTLVGLFHQEELGYTEITAITGLPEGTVKNYLFRARKTLRTNLLKNYSREDL